MKTKLSLTALLSLVFGLWSSQAQIPQGFNYQAVARLTTGDPIINTTLPVRITIQADSLGTSIIWQELHSSVTTNGFGLITLILGKGARQAVSTVSTFNAIDWTISPKFIKTEINYSGWKTMGVTRFWSVPYSKIAENLGGPVKKLAVTGTTLLNDEALFEVKNKDGNTVFAVYNEGVRVYVADGAKGLKGGFAVGGFGTDKAESQKYMVVSKDSVRIYLDTNPLTKKLKGGFAVGGYDLTKGIVQDYLDVNSDSVRIYIDSNPATKKVKGGFAVGGYDMTKGNAGQYLRVTVDSTRIITQDTLKGFGVSNLSSGSTQGYLRLTPSNYFIGHLSGKNLTTGLYNSVIGYQSGRKINSGKSNSFMGYKTGYSNTTGNYNVFIGNEAGFSNNGSMNTFVGYISGRNNTSGYYNSFYGDSTGYSNTTGSMNTFLGGKAGFGNTSGKFNIFVGSQSGYNNTTGNENTFLGTYAGFSNTSGWSNVMIGVMAGKGNTTGYQNIMIGENAGANNKGNTNIMIGDGAGFNNSGTSNLMIGPFSGFYNSTGYTNIFFGNNSGNHNTTGYENVMVGTITGYNNTTGSGNVFVGMAAGHDNAAGYGNVLIGDNAGHGVIGSANVMVGRYAGSNNAGNNNVFIGPSAGIQETTGSNKLYIANSTTNPPLIYGDFSAGTIGLGTITPNTAYKLYVNGGLYANSIHVGSGDLQLSGGSITNLSGGITLGGATSGWYSDNANLAARFPGASGDFYVQSSGGGTTYLRVGASVSGMRLFSGNAVFSNSVGIGTASPLCPLHVETSITMASAYFAYYNVTGVIGTVTASAPYSIFAQSRIRAEEFNSDSDIRIKKIIGLSNSKNDLEILRKIKVTDFTYLDSIAKGNTIHKKVIAQELKEILSNAVTSTTSFIPSIYARPASATFDIEKHRMVITMSKEHGLKPGDNVKFIEPDGTWNEQVTMIISPVTFCVSSQKERSTLFVYGKEVSDFLTVDYEAIAMLNVSTTQELIRKSDAQQQQIESQQQQIDRLVRMVEEMDTKIASSSR